MSRGTPDLRRSWPDVGLVRVASGTRNAKTRRRLNAMLTDLHDAGRLDWLRALRRREVRPLEVLELLGEHTPAALPKPQTRPFTIAAVSAWAKSYDAGAAHRRDLAHYLTRLAGEAERLADLPDAVRDAREAYRRRGQAQAFAHLRAAAMTYLRDTVGRRHPVYLAVADIRPLKGQRKREGHPCTVPEAFALAALLGPEIGPVWLTMCLSGVGPKELWVDGVTVHGEHLRVRGVKRAGRDRLVPRVVLGTIAPVVTVPAVTPRWFARRLKRVSEGRVQPYDGRRTFARWCALAGVPPVHVDAYLGHGPRTMTALYQQGNEGPYLDRDAGLVAAFVETELARGPVAALPAGAGA